MPAATPPRLLRLSVTVPPTVEPPPRMIESLVPGAPRSKPRAEPLLSPSKVEPSVTAEPSKRFRVAPLATLSAETPPTVKPAPRVPCDTVAVPPLRLTEPAIATLPRPVLVRVAAEAAPTVPARLSVAKRFATFRVAPVGPKATFWAAVMPTGTACVPVPT